MEYVLINISYGWFEYPSILSEFEACADQEKIECKGYVYMDV
jgi:hypothetical protein